MRTFPLTDTPSTWGAWDTRPRLSDMVDPDAERKAEVEMLAEQFMKAMERCDESEDATFARRVRDRSSKDTEATRWQLVGEVLMDVLAEREFYMRTAHLLMLVAAGHQCQNTAQRLLADAAANWADMEVGNV